MNSSPNTNSKKKNSFKIINSQQQSFTIQFSLIDNKYEIMVICDSSFAISYKVSLEVDEFYKINRFFRQFDTINEIWFRKINRKNRYSN